VLSNGCSFLGVQSVHEPEINAIRQRVKDNEPLEGIRSECTSSRAAPIVDSVFGGIFGVNTLGSALLPADSFKPLGVSQTTVLLAGVTATVLYLGSAGYGFNATDDCLSFYRRIDEDTAARNSTRRTPKDTIDELELLRERVRRLERDKSEQ
jgi:hypothetical protein